MIPALAVDLCKTFEGFHHVVQRQPELMAAPYICPAGFWTIGWGSLCAKDHPNITEAEGEVLLARDLQTALAAVVRWCPVLLAGPERRLAAVISWTFNLGAGRLKSSTMRLRINDQHWDEAALEMRKWVWGGGRKLPGLIRRREAEAALLI